MPPRSRAKPASEQSAPVKRAPVQPAPVEEEIDIAVSTEDEDEDEDTLPAPAKARASAHPTPAGRAKAPDGETTRVAPIIKPVVKSNRALDIDLIFDRGKGKPSVCKYCK
jgi:hypothetical protein